MDNRLAQAFRFALHEEQADVIRVEIVRRLRSIVAKLMSIHASVRGKDIDCSVSVAPFGLLERPLWRCGMEFSTCSIPWAIVSIFQHLFGNSFRKLPNLSLMWIAGKRQLSSPGLFFKPTARWLGKPFQIGRKKTVFQVASSLKPSDSCDPVGKR